MSRFDLQFLIIPLLSFGHCVVCLLYYYSFKKKKHGENDVTSGHVTDVTSGSTPFPNYDGLQILKTAEVLIKPITCGCRNTHRVMMKNPIIF